MIRPDQRLASWRDYLGKRKVVFDEMEKIVSSRGLKWFNMTDDMYFGPPQLTGHTLGSDEVEMKCIMVPLEPREREVKT